MSLRAGRGRQSRHRRLVVYAERHGHSYRRLARRRRRRDHARRQLFGSRAHEQVLPRRDRRVTRTHARCEVARWDAEYVRLMEDNVLRAGLASASARARWFLLPAGFWIAIGLFDM